MNLLPLLCVLVLALLVSFVEPHPPRTTFIWPGYCFGKLTCGSSPPYAPTCIDTVQVCDGVNDCPGATDEMFCPREPDCYPGMLCEDRKTCATRCDKVTECPTGDDEVGCPFTCPNNEYKCDGEERCFRLDQVCDGQRQCLYGEDERQCAPDCYKSRQILCHDKRTCARPCNGVPECGVTAEDEADCPFICNERQYSCVGENKCIDIEQICDFTTDCRHGEDEAFCSDPCPPGWYRFRNSCYFFKGLTGRMYEDAVAYCENLGSQLVTINDQAENEFLQEVAAERTGDRHWIGLNDRDEEGVFRWLSTGAEPVFTDWHSTEPTSSHVKDDCVVLFRELDYQWEVDLCTKTRRFICEQPAG